ncbi:MAG: hypothetical protein EBZ47_05260 [Chlamydiae bacterium]|nr:hypothetical protein [Chlamydiota bacterium]
MSYHAYLLLQNTVQNKEKVGFWVDGINIFFEKVGLNSWQLSMKILDPSSQKIPSYIRQVFSISGIFKWQEKGAYLKIDPLSQEIYLYQQVESSTRYKSFRYLIHDFLAKAQDWRSWAGISD